MIKNFLFFLLLLVMQPVLTDGQTSKIDSLKQALQRERQDTSRVLLLCELIYAYTFTKPDTALLLAQQAVSLARQKKYLNGEAKGLSLTSGVFYQTGNYPKALELLLEAQKKYEGIKNQEGIAYVLGGIGIVYAEQGDYRQALNYMFKSKAITETLYNKWFHTNSLINIGHTYYLLNNIDSARFYTLQGHDLSLRLHDIEAIGTALNNLGNIYSKMNEPAIAMEFYRSAIHLNKDENYETICESSLGIAKLFKKTGQIDSALHYARLSMATAQNVGFTNHVLDASTFLTDYYKAAGITDSAFVYQSASVAAKDSLFSQEKTRQMQNLSLTETLRQQELKAQKQRAAEEQKRNLAYAAIAVALIIFFYRYRISQLVKQQQIRRDIASDLHDDIGSTLNATKIFVHMAASSPNQGGQYFENVKENLDAAIVSLRDMMWILDNTLDTVESMVDRLKSFYEPLADAQNISIHFIVATDVRSHVLSKKEKRNLLLIAKEAVNNTIKYANCRNIFLNITSRDKKLVFEILDDGNGFDVNLKSGGYGLKNIKQRSEQIGYQVFIDSEDRKGTQIKLVKQ